MKLVLQRKSLFGRVALFNPDAGTISEAPRAEIPERDRGLHGVYDYLGNQVAILYLRGGRLRFRLGAVDLPMDEATQLEVTETRSRRRLELRRGGEIVASAEYDRPIPDKLLSVEDHIADEDIDFGIWASAIANSRERQSILLQAWLAGE